MNARIFAKGNKRTINNLKKFRSEAQKEKAPRVVQRMQGVMLSLEKYSINDIARFLHVQRSTVHNWITAWNEFLFPLTMTKGMELRTISVGLALFIDEFGVNWGELMAASILMSIPAIIVFATFQKNLIKGLSEGAVKG